MSSSSPAQQRSVQDADTRLPIYQRLRDLFMQKIRAGEWAGSEALPSEIELALAHGVAPGTVRKAIESLVADGYLVRRQGKGTFVRRADFGSALFRFFRHTDPSGQVVQPTSQILLLGRSKPSTTELTKLNLKTADSVIRIRRLRSFEREPWIFEEISVSSQMFAPLLDADRASFGDLLYPAYESLCNVRVHRVLDTIRFGFATPVVAKHLQTEAGEPVAIIERQAFSIDDRPIEWRVSYGLASRFSYSIELK
jgi:GntR family transcriptional regulator